MTSVNTIPVNIPNTSYNNEVRLRQERIEEHYNAKKQIVERDREKRTPVSYTHLTLPTKA